MADRPPAPEHNQRTLAAEASIRGVGLFSGQPVTVTLRPAPADHGVVFRRTDLPGSPSIPARVDFIVDRPRRTALRAPGPAVGSDEPGAATDQPQAVVETVEHLLSALAGLGVDNALIDVDAGELPIGDGSSLPFVEAIDRAGIADLEAARRPLIVTEPVTVRSPSGLPDGGEAVIFAVPNESPSLELAYDLDYGLGATLERQFTAFTLRREELEPVGPAHRHAPGTNGSALAHTRVTDAPFARQIAPARSFALLAEAQALRARGLFAHVTPREMLVIGEDGPVDNAYRFDDEPVRHKLLDLLGDLALVGRPIQGRIYASRSGHALNHRMARALVEQARRTEGTRRRPAGAGPAEGATRAPAMDCRDVLRLLPHRFPMALVDRVIEIDQDRRAVGIKNVTINEPFFQGHYPGSPIMPGVLIVEAMSQLAGLMLSQKLERTGKIAVLLSMDRVKLRKPVVPGDQLVMETEVIKASERFGDVQCKARVDGRLVAEARVKFMMVDAEPAR